jgi:hypothetical protein
MGKGRLVAVARNKVAVAAPLPEATNLIGHPETAELTRLPFWIDLKQGVSTLLILSRPQLGHPSLGVLVHRYSSNGRVTFSNAARLGSSA